MAGPESQIQRMVVAYLQTLGCAVYPTSQYRASRVAKGIPDLYVMHERIGGFWVEVKAAGGKQSPDQKAFEAVCKRCGVPYLLGGMDAVQALFA